MVESRKKKPLRGSRARLAALARASKRKSGGKKSSDPLEAEKKQHKMNWNNAAVIIKDALSKVSQSGVDDSLIEILKIVRHWPARFKETDPLAFSCPFSATQISAEEVTQDDDTITKVSFTNSGEVYDFVYRTRKSSGNDDPMASITLHENGERVINMIIIQDPANELYAFKELNAFTFGTWMENIINIRAEIELHREKNI